MPRWIRILTVILMGVLGAVFLVVGTFIFPFHFIISLVFGVALLFGSGILTSVWRIN